MASRRIAIVGGKIATHEQEFIGDLLLVDGKVAAVEKGTGRAYTPDTVIVNAAGKIVIPGAIDPHVHLEYPQGGNKIVSCDDFRTGSVAAVAGGTTCLVDFIEARADETFMQALDARKKAAEQRSIVDFSLHMAINRTDPASIAELPLAVSAGVSSFKIYTAYDGIRLTDSQMLVAFEALKRCGGLPIIHAENHDLIMHELAKFKTLTPPVSPVNHPLTRPVQGEAEATCRVIMLAESVGVPAGIHIVHVTAGLAVPIIKAAQARKGFGPVSGEVCSHHLALTDSVYSRVNGADFVCAPPLRPQSDVEAMWAALKDETLSFIVTDHCPFTSRQRRGQRRTPEFTRDPKTGQRVPNKEDAAAEQWSESMPSFFQMPGGVAGLENRVALAYDEAVLKRGISLPQFVRAVSTEAAKRYNMFPRKGALIPGVSDADVVIIDPAGTTEIHQQTLHHNCDYTPFEGMKLQGRIDTVIVHGVVAVQDGKVLGDVVDSLHGRFIARKPY